MSNNELKQYKNIAVSVLSGQTVQSGNINKLGMALVGIVIPAGFTGTTITFQNSVDGSTYQAVITEAGAALTVTVVADRYVQIDPQKTRGFQWLKIVTGSAQGADRALVAVFEVQN